MKSLLAAAVLLALPLAAPALAQDGGADPHAPGAYAGHGPNAFYDVDARISRMEERTSGMRGPQARRVRAELRAIRGMEATQRQRHGGELRDWDREALNTRLDRLEAQFHGPQG